MSDPKQVAPPSPYRKVFPLFLISLTTFVCLIVFNRVNTQISLNPPVMPTIAPTPTPTPYFTNFALLGYGGGGHEGGALTDSMLVVRVDDKRRTVFLISVPRDTAVQLPILKDGQMYQDKINAAYVWGNDDRHFPHKPEEFKKEKNGGGNLAKYALEQVIGEKISNYAAISFRGFIDFIDHLGGIEITRSTSFTDAWYPIEGKKDDPCGKSEEEVKQIEATLSGYLREREFPCRFETITFPRGTQTLDGETALKYVRSRHSETEGNDFHRSQRQKQVVEAVKKKMLTLASVPDMIRFATTLHEYVDTDLKRADIATLVQRYILKKDYQIKSVALTTNAFREDRGNGGQYLLIPRAGKNNFTQIHAYLQDIYEGISEASAAARFAPSKIPTRIPLSPNTITP
jgi:anionic cell wall polymer biosynthesis LytR-Cps2A-Psr (LCP) family protein